MPVLLVLYLLTPILHLCFLSLATLLCCSSGSDWQSVPVSVVSPTPRPWGQARSDCDRSSHLGIHKQTNACWSIPRSQTVFIHYKICRRYAESWNFEAFVIVHCCQLRLIQPLILTNKHNRFTITTTSSSNYQLFMTAPQKNTPGSVLLDINRMPCIVLFS